MTVIQNFIRFPFGRTAVLNHTSAIHFLLLLLLLFYFFFFDNRIICWIASQSAAALTGHCDDLGHL